MKTMGTEEKPKKRTCKGYFVDFSSNSSLHGIKYTGEFHRSLIERTFWIAAILVSFTACAYLIVKLWIKWEQNPVIVSFAESPTPIWQIPFPAVTICPGVAFNLELFNFTDVCDEPETYDDEAMKLYDIVAPMCSANYLNRSTEYVTEETVKRLAEVSKDVSDMLLNCKYGQIENCLELFSPILTNDGVCIAFNMLNAKEIYSQGIQRDFDFHLNHNKTSNGWSPETMYENTAKIQTYPLRSMGKGRNAGLLLFFKTPKHEENNRCNSMLEGFKVIFHTPDAIPQTDEDFFWISINAYSLVVIKPEMMTTSEGLRNYSPERRSCYFLDERKLKYFNKYNRDNCLLECWANYTKAICGCVDFGMPRDNATRICAVGKENCINEVNDLIMRNELLTEGREMEYVIDGNMVLPKCDCLPSCTSISYDKVTTQMPLKWKEFFSAIKAAGAEDEEIEELKNYNLAIAELYFNQPEFTTSKRSELYGVVDFLSNCGGLLGVCLGFSVLSLVEIFYFFVMRVSFDAHENIKSKGRQNSRL